MKLRKIDPLAGGFDFEVPDRFVSREEVAGHEFAVLSHRRYFHDPRADRIRWTARDLGIQEVYVRDGETWRLAFGKLSDTALAQALERPVYGGDGRPRGEAIEEMIRTERLRDAIQRPTKTSLWGQGCTVVPVFVDERFGDGGKLIWLEPIMTRPQYYVVRVDSSWNISNYAPSPTVGEHVHEIERCIEEEFGYGDDEDDRGRERSNPWPALASGGCSWGEMDWPEGLDPEDPRQAPAPRSP